MSVPTGGLAFAKNDADEENSGGNDQQGSSNDQQGSNDDQQQLYYNIYPYLTYKN